MILKMRSSTANARKTDLNLANNDDVQGFSSLLASASPGLLCLPGEAI
jgi:hypothetical protein